MSRLQATFITMFKEPLSSWLGSSIMGRAHKTGVLTSQVDSILESVSFNHHAVDDTPYGGGPGELMKVDVIAPLIEKALRKTANLPREKKRVLLMDPAGHLFQQSDAERLSHFEEHIYVCGRYEGIDARVYHYVDEAMSVGNYVLSSGDLAAMIIFDATARMVDGFLGNFQSTKNESHRYGRLEAGQYTRPRVFSDLSVPTVFQSGNHAEIDKARKLESLCRTMLLRPDLLQQFPPTEEEKSLLLGLNWEKLNYPWMKRHE